MRQNLWENTRFQAGVLVLASLGYSYAAWLKLGAFWGDPARSLFEFYRAANGEIPYRDFSFQYPPLAIALISPILRWFGATFQVAQVTYDLLGFGCVFGVWFLARRLMPSVAAFLVTLGFIFCGGGGGLTVFHLRTYSPSNLVGFIGIVLSCSGLVDTIRGKFDHRIIVLLGVGGFFSCMGRPDAAAAVVAGLVCLIVSEGRSALSIRASVRRWLGLAAIMLAPSVLCYGLLLAKLGKPVVEGISAYGAAWSACPLWPTGFGLVSAAVALGAVLAALGLLELAGRLFFSVPLRPSTTLYLLAVAGGGAWLWNYGVLFSDLIRHEGVRHGLLDVAAVLIEPWTFISSVRWTSNLLFFAGLVAYCRAQRATKAEDTIFFVLMGVMTGLCLRGFFNSIHTDVPELPATLVALAFPLFPLIARQTVRIWTSGRWATDSYFEMRHSRRIFLLGSLWLCLFGGFRVIGDTLRDHIRPYRLVQTAAGSVRINDGGVSNGVYEFLKKNTTPGEPIADFAYGGGINFALHRTSPLYTTEFVNFLPSEAQRLRDRDQLRESSVRFVISSIPPPFEYGTTFGCAFPRFVWKIEGSTGPPKATFPVMDLIEEQYRLAGRFDEIAIYARRASPAP
jgi:hypothetical protein